MTPLTPRTTARVMPEGWRELAASVAAGTALPVSAQRHRDTLERLAAGLSDDYTIYHGLHWTKVEQGFSVFGEIDFVIVNRAAQVLLVEQKTGLLEEGAEGLLKRERGRTRNISAQMAQTVAAVREKLARRPGCAAVPVDYLLYCPDHRIRQAESAGLALERLVDATRRDELLPTIRTILPPGGGDTLLASAAPAACQQLDRFWRDVIELEADVDALIDQTQALVTRISGGLAYWARQLEFTPFRLHVNGTAGSGKTQLARAEYRAAIERGQRPVYVCFNRPLADQFALQVPPGGEVCTFHTLCQRRLREAGQPVDVSGPDGFERLVSAAAALPVEARWRFDTVLVDEGQDFPIAWRDQILRHATESARIIWLEDPMQALYPRDPAPLPGWVTLHARANYRSPREVVELLRAILPAEVVIEAAGPLAQAQLEILTYADQEGVLAATKEAIRKCLAAGFRRQDMAVITFRGREQSRLLGLDQLGPHPIRRFTGRYDLLGQPIFTEGELLVESVYRFKGQSAPAVIVTEIDFEVLDERTVRKLFVGATRAAMRLTLVASERAAKRLQQARPTAVAGGLAPDEPRTA